MSMEQMVITGVASAMVLFMVVLGGTAFLTRDKK
jgi:hypothetical protein